MSELAEYLKRLADGQIPTEAPPECEAREELAQLVAYLGEISQFSRSMANGDLSASLRLRGSLAGAMKGLHANLRHLTWQTQEIAAGDFTQRVDFLGEFSVAFNHMVEALAKGRDDLTAKNTELGAALSDLKATQSQLLQQEKMASVGQLAAGVAHEINNPMGFIISNLGSLRKYSETLKEYVQAADSMLASCSEADRAKMNALQSKLDLPFLMEDMPSLIKESLDGAERVRIIVQSLKSFSAVDQQGPQPININDYLDSTVNVAWNELKDKAEVVRECRVCGFLLQVPGLTCPRCGAEVAIVLSRAQRIERNALMRELKAQDIARRKEQWSEIKAGWRAERRKPTFGDLLQAAQALGYSSGWAAQMFRVYWGSWPRRERAA